MSLESLLLAAGGALQTRLAELGLDAAPPPSPAGIVLWFCVGQPTTRAHILLGRGSTLAQAWADGRAQLDAWAQAEPTAAAAVTGLRVEMCSQIESLPWGRLREIFSRTKRNYFRFGLSFDAAFTTPILEQELAANAILYDSQQGVATPNSVNLASYGRRRWGQPLHWPEQDDTLVWRFQTCAVYADANGVHTIEGSGRNSGYRTLPDWGPDTVDAVVHSATDYLARQVKPDGAYHYGWFPCFDRAIPTYNALRHASSTYALLEGWEHTREPAAWQAIVRALDYLRTTLIRPVNLPNGTPAAFVVDTGDEIKLGANAVAILALVKYTELSGDEQHLPLLAQLAEGILHLQSPETGEFVHVLNYPDLSLKARHRIIYYDGEAAFGLMRLYGLTREPRWLAAVELAFDSFIAREHWRAHDHWLSYAVNELTLYRPDVRYFQFGLANVEGYLDFVLERITTYPTLLELMMAAQRMLVRMRAEPALAPLLRGFDQDKFDQALAHRARYLLNGFFWPELAMFFANPARIEGSFFIRHHTYRVRIDDVEHYLSGLVGYGAWWREQQALAVAADASHASAEPELSIGQGTLLGHWRASDSQWLQAHGIDVTFSAGTIGQWLLLILCAQAVDRGRLKLDQMVTVSPEAAGHQGPASGPLLGLRAGEVVPLRLLLQAVAVLNAVDAATCLLPLLGRNPQAVLQLQRDLAARLGLQNTTVLHPVFMPRVAQHTTLRDALRLMQHVVTQLPHHLYWWQAVDVVWQGKVLRSASNLVASGRLTAFMALGQPAHHGVGLMGAGASWEIVAVARARDAFHLDRRMAGLLLPEPVLAQPVQAIEGNVGLQFLGDTYFGEWYSQRRQRQGRDDGLTRHGYSYCTQGLLPLLHSSDYTIANLETALTSLPEPATLQGRKPFVLLGEPEPSLTTLRELGVDALALGNNHACDAGVAGLADMLQHVDRHGFARLGAGLDAAEAEAPLALQWGGQEIRLFSAYWYRQYLDVACQYYALPGRAGVACLGGSLEDAIRAEKRRSPEAKIIVLAHWGGDYTWTAARQRLLGQGLIDAGTDLILGSGSHMLGEFERYRGRWILYSMGNGIFNSDGEYVQRDVPPYSFMVRLVAASAQRTDAHLYPITSNNQETFWQPKPVDSAGRDAVHQVLVARGLPIAAPGAEPQAGQVAWRQDARGYWMLVLPGALTQGVLPVDGIGQSAVPGTLGELRALLPLGSAMPSTHDHVEFRSVAYSGGTLRAPAIALVYMGVEGEGLTQTQLQRQAPRLVATLSQLEVVPLPDLPHLHVPRWPELFRALGWQRRSNFTGVCFAVTGSAGKSSINSMLQSSLVALHGQEVVLSTQGMTSNLWRGVLATLSQLLPVHRFLVQEVDAGSIRPTVQILRPHVALLANVVEAHVGTYGSLQRIADVKAGLFEGLVPGGTAVIGRDSLYFDRVLGHALAAQAVVVTYGVHADATWRLLSYDLASGAIEFLAQGERVQARVLPRMMHQAINLLGALAALAAAGQDWRAALHVLERWQPPQGRGDRFELALSVGGTATVVDDAFNAAPAAMVAALQALAAHREAGRRVVVLGEMLQLGESSHRLHTELAQVIADLDIDQVHLVGAAYADCWAGLPERQRGGFYADREALEASLSALIQPGDLWWFKGAHGSGIYQTVAKLRASRAESRR